MKRNLKGIKNVTLLELIQKLIKPESADVVKALDLEVEFRTIRKSKLFSATDKANLSLLSVYEDEGKIIIEIGA